MARVLPGGENPFNIQLRPSVFNKLPIQETIDRLGEPVIWLREMPTPYVSPGRHTLPDQPADSKGFFHGIPDEIQVDRETSIAHWRSGRRIYTNQAPISRMIRAQVFRRADFGGSYDLDISEVGPNWFEYSGPVVPDYYQIFLDYKIKTTTDWTGEVVHHQDGRILRLSGHPELITDQESNFVNVLVGVVELHRFRADGTLELETGYSFDFSNIYLSKPWVRGTRFRVCLRLLNTFRIAYRHMSSKTAEARGIKVTAGDMEAVTSPYMRLAEGDLVIFTRTIKTAKETTHASSGFRLTRHPVHSIESCLALDSRDRIVALSPDEIGIDGFQRLVLPQEYVSASVIYNYHPQYRVLPQLEASGLANQLQPPIWHLSADTTNILLKGSEA